MKDKKIKAINNNYYFTKMKKLVLSLLLISSITGMYAQKANVSKAKNKVLQEAPDFAGARELIKPALEEATTKNVANTWYVAGLIGYQENKDIETKGVLNPESIDQNKKGEVVMESLGYFIVADSLDQLPNEKGKVRPKYRRDIKRMVKEYYDFSLIGYGAHLFDQRDYNGALNVFATFLAIPDMPLSENGIVKDSTYNMIQYYAAIAASNAEKGDEAIKYYEALKDKDYETLAVYQLLYEEYNKKNDTINFVQTLKEGIEKFPNEPWFLQNLINYYIYSGQTETALTYLQTAIERDPSLAQYRFVEGGLHESLGDLEAAEAAYKKAVEMDPTLASAYDALGRLHYNKAIAILDAADANMEIRRSNKLYKAEQDKATEEFKAALPFYTKAKELSPEETSYKVMLRTLYYRLGMDAEYEAMDKEING